MKIDAHQHFWNYNNLEFGWIGDNMATLKRDFLPEHLQIELNTIGFDGSIAVQARQTVAETQWLLELSQNNSFIKGVVGWVNLCSPKTEMQLAEFSKHPKFVGVRHVVHDEPDDNFMARPDFRVGIALLEKYKLNYDLLIFPKHLPLAIDLVKNYPNQTFILDHIAKPFIKNQLREPWASQIKELASLPNVYCKLSGMVTEADWSNWVPSDFDFYLNTVFESFGPQRLMIGSDWPVCSLAGTYSKVMELVINRLSQFSISDRLDILGRNCEKCYLGNK